MITRKLITTVEAVQVNRFNIKEVGEWCGHCISNKAGYYTIEKEKGTIIGFSENDWVTKDGKVIYGGNVCVEEKLEYTLIRAN